MPNGATYEEIPAQTDLTSAAELPRYPNRHATLWIALALATVTFAVYLPTLHNGFISYDDAGYIYSNPLVQQGLTWHGIRQAFTTFDQANWFPLEWISLMATSQFFGISPFAYHLTNLVLHMANVVLLFLLLQAVTKRTARSVVVAALFAVFPLNVEAVAWATERKSVLSVFFMLLALAAYGWYVRRPNPARFLTVAVLFALGLMTKAWLVTFPFALLLLDYWPLQRFGNEAPPPADRFGPGRFGPDRFGAERTFRELVLEKIPLFVMSFAAVAIGVVAARSGEALSISAAHAPFSLRFENALWSCLDYILKGIWPLRLSIIYPYPKHLFPIWMMAASAIFLAAVTAIVWRFRQQKYLLTGWLWYLGVLFPVIGLVQTGVQSMADRWAYISFLGLFVAVVWAVADSAGAVHSSRVALAAASGAILAAYACVSFVQSGYWRDGLTLYTHALQVTKDNGPVSMNLGAEYELIGRPDIAFRLYQQAALDTPSLGVAHYNFARLLDAQHRPMEAIAEYNLAITNTGVSSEIARAHTGLGKIDVDMNLPEKALEEFSAAIAADPSEVYAVIDRGMIEYQQRDLEGARQDFSHATQLLPTPMTWFTLGMVLEKQKDVVGAVQAYEEALRMNPNLTDAQTHLQALGRQLH
jgi:Tfp pilus assembly protein PilF